MKQRLIIEVDIEAEPALDDPMDIADNIVSASYEFGCDPDIISAEWKLDDSGYLYNERE